MGRCALSFRHWYGRDVLDRGRDVVSHWLPVVSAIAWEGVIAGQCRAKARLGAPDRGKYREAARVERCTTWARRPITRDHP